MSPEELALADVRRHLRFIRHLWAYVPRLPTQKGLEAYNKEVRRLLTAALNSTIKEDALATLWSKKK